MNGGASMAAEPTDPLKPSLEREHHQIDGELEEFLRHPDRPDGVAALSRAATALREHIYLEETHLFPPLRASGLMAPVLVMLREHGEIWKLADAVEKQVADGADVEELRRTGRDLLAALQRHNDKEEPIIYAEADRVIDETVRSEVNALLGDVGMPAGWVCQMAGTTGRGAPFGL